MRVRHLLALAATGGALLVVPLAEPAAAAVTASTSGTTLTITMTGNGSAPITCAGGNVAVAAVVAAPALACGSLTAVTVTGDGGNQILDLRGLSAAGFSGTTTTNVSMGGGTDQVTEGRGVDTIDLGDGGDILTLLAVGPPNASVSLGGSTDDRLDVQGGDGDDTIAVTASSPTTSIAFSGATATTRSATGAEYIYLFGGKGDDHLSTTGIVAGTTLSTVILRGEDGDDVLTGGNGAETLYGNGGTNELRSGGGADGIWTESSTDLVDTGADSILDYVYDTTSYRIDRDLDHLGAEDSFHVQANRSDVVTRIRPTGTPGEQRWTVSLHRTGQLVFPAGAAGLLAPSHFTSGAPNHRSIVDVVAGPRVVDGVGANGGPNLLDVTVPSGGWEVTTAGPDNDVVGVSPDDSTYQYVRMGRTADYRVHGPWTDRNRGFAHRATRDLLFRFASDGELEALDAALDGGSVTRAQVTALLMGSDEYRGLDVDRVFLTYLRRAADPGGRTYWINSIRNGKALWRFRAQLFGSNEYFTKAGGTNAAYVLSAYQDVLGRRPDPSGQAYWTNKLNNGADRGSVALQFINSPEARRRLVDDQFLRFLDRYPTTAEQTTWVAQIPSSDGEQRLVAFLVNSSAYFTRD